MHGTQSRMVDLGYRQTAHAKENAHQNALVYEHIKEVMPWNISDVSVHSSDTKLHTLHAYTDEGI